MSTFETICINGVERSISEAILFLDEHTPMDRTWTDPIANTLRDFLQGKLSTKTSGTTGTPSVVNFDLEEIVASARITEQAFGLKKGDRVLHCLPSKFIAGKMMIIRAIVSGLDLHIVPPVGDLKEHVKGNYSFAAMIPLQMQQLLKYFPDKWPIDKIILGGGPVSAALASKIRTNSVEVWHTYASTETCTHVAIRSITKAETAYQALSDVSFDTDANNRLVISTPHLQRTTHRTKDVVELHNTKQFTWLGRADNVVLSGGLKLYPEQLEDKCSSLLKNNFYFGGEKDDVLGERLVLFIEGYGKAERILQRLSTVLSKHELPKKVVFLDEFEKTETGKIKRLPENN